MFKNYTVLALIFFFSFILHGLVVPKESTGQQQDVVACTILKTMDAAGYTYFKADTGEQQEWVAIPRTIMKVGDNVAFYEGMTMVNFFSKTLSRTFETIIFSPGLVSQVPKEIIDAVNANPKTDKNQKKTESNEPDGLETRLPDQQHIPQQIDPSTRSGGSLAAMATQEDISLPKTKGDSALTVGEIYKNSLKLNGTTVRVRGKVVKYSPNIMGKNWLHIQDGTGSALNNSHDLVVTTTEVPGNMSDISLEGTLAADKDFGSGYHYSVIIEDAIIIK